MKYLLVVAHPDDEVWGQVRLCGNGHMEVMKSMWQ